MNRTVLFIHDAWLTPAIWNHFKGRFSACGYSCLTPPWPSLGSQSEAVLPGARPASLGLARIIDHYASIVEGLPYAPLLVGHGVGGLVVQLLLDRGLGTAGIAIAPIPPRGVQRSALAFNLLPLLLNGGVWEHKAEMTFEYFATKVAQRLSSHEQCAAYRRHIVAAPRRILYETILGIRCSVDFSNDQRAPLLLIVGEKDHVIRASLVEAIYNHHHQSIAPTSFECFADRSHWLIAEPGWEEVADYLIEWSQTQSGRF